MGMGVQLYRRSVTPGKRQNNNWATWQGAEIAGDLLRCGLSQGIPPTQGGLHQCPPTMQALLAATRTLRSVRHLSSIPKPNPWGGPARRRVAHL